MSRNPSLRKIENHELKLIHDIVINEKLNIQYLDSINKDTLVKNTDNASIDFPSYFYQQCKDMKVRVEYLWTSKKGNMMGLFLFTCNEELGGIDVYSLDGIEDPIYLPAFDMLSPLP